jgi:hypothetical protein
MSGTNPMVGHWEFIEGLAVALKRNLALNYW